MFWAQSWYDAAHSHDRVNCCGRAPFVLKQQLLKAIIIDGRHNMGKFEQRERTPNCTGLQLCCLAAVFTFHTQNQVSLPHQTVCEDTSTVLISPPDTHVSSDTLHRFLHRITQHG